MLTTATLEKTLSLLDKDYTFASITEKTGITLEDAEAIHIAWFKGKTEQLFRELQLARGCGNETPHGLGLGRRHNGRRASRNPACLSRTVKKAVGEIGERIAYNAERVIAWYPAVGCRRHHQ